MDQTLQKRFTVTAMTAITVLILIIITCNITLNVFFTVRQTNSTLNMLSETQFGDREDDTEFGRPPDDGSRHEDRKPPEDGRYRGIFFTFGNNLIKRNRMTAMYITAVVGEDGSIREINTERSTLSETEAAEVVLTVMSKQKDTGAFGAFRYKKLPMEDGATKCVCLDRAAHLMSILNAAVISFAAGIVGWWLMLLLVLALSKKAIRPIAENMKRQKQFVTDAGHEIKTPLAIILANTDAMELHNGENKWSRNIRDQVGRLTGLTQNLLTLAKMDEYSVQKSSESFSFSELITGTVEMFIESAALKGVTIRTEIDDDIMLKANIDLISRLVSVLLDNAVKYSSENSEIRLAASGGEKHVSLKIGNFCDALPDCESEKLFDRFYRADTSRRQSDGGYGIGLSAAKTITDLHKGSIHAEYKPDNFIEFTVKI